MTLPHAARLLDGELLRKNVRHYAGTSVVPLQPTDEIYSLVVNLSCTDVGSIRDAIGDIPLRYDRHIVHVRLGVSRE